MNPENQNSNRSSGCMDDEKLVRFIEPCFTSASNRTRIHSEKQCCEKVGASSHRIKSDCKAQSSTDADEEVKVRLLKAGEEVERNCFMVWLCLFCLSVLLTLFGVERNCFMVWLCLLCLSELFTLCGVGQYTN